MTIPYEELPIRYAAFIQSTAAELWALIDQQSAARNNRPIKLFSQQTTEVQTTMTDIVELIANLHITWCQEMGWDLKPIELDEDMTAKLQKQMIKTYEHMFCAAPSLAMLCGAERGEYKSWLKEVTSQHGLHGLHGLPKEDAA